MTQAANLAALGTNAGTTGILPAAGGGTAGTGGAIAFKNRIINGAMTFDQRWSGASVTPTSGSYTLDRWNFVLSQTSKLTCQQLSASPPTGFTYYQGITSSSAYSITSGDYFQVNQIIEGYNIADLGWGTANAKTVTLSFWVQSSLTGTFGGSLRNYGVTRSYPFTYTISSANTWTQISVTIAGDTNGTWLTTNGWGIQVIFGLGIGSTYSGTAGSWASANYASATGAVSVVGTSGATFYVTGVQLEVGTAATNFDFRSYGTELALCQRYYNKLVLGDTATGSSVGIQAFVYNSSLAIAYFTYPVAMRTAPSLVTTGSASNYQILQYGGAITLAGVPTNSNVSTTTSALNCNASGVNVGQGCAFRGNNNLSTDWVAFSAEL